MKLFRFAGLLIIAAALSTGSATTATASPPYYCYKYCSGIFYSGYCNGSLSQCCNFNHRCPDPYVLEGGDCTDGQSYCP